jgi:hypothetical protein
MPKRRAVCAIVSSPTSSFPSFAATVLIERRNASRSVMSPRNSSESKLLGDQGSSPGPCSQKYGLSAITKEGGMPIEKAEA